MRTCHFSQSLAMKKRISLTDKLVTQAVKEAVADFLSCDDLDAINTMLREFLCLYVANEGERFMVLDMKILYHLFYFLDELKEHMGEDND